jgi:hypothetical protein
MKKTIISTAVSLALFGGAAVALAFSPNAYTLFGDAQKISPGHDSNTAVELDSLTSGTGYGGIDFTIDTPLTLSGLNTLSTDYNITNLSSCGGGSPRFEVALGNPTTGTFVGNMFVYIGPPPGYTGCPPFVWSNTGNLLTPASLVDTSQLPGGNFYDTYAHAQTILGNYKVLGVDVVLDGSWMFPLTGQIINIDNTLINSTLYTYESTPTSKDQCKEGSWGNYTRADGSHFKNQGDCIQYVNTGK